MNIFFFLSAMGHALNWRHTENKFMGLPWNSEIYIKNKQGFVTFSSVGFVQDSKLTFWGLKTYDNRLVVSNIALVPTLLSCVCVCVCITWCPFVHPAPTSPFNRNPVAFWFRQPCDACWIAPHWFKNLFYFHPQGISAAILSKCTRDGGFIPVNKNLW